jgi:hypothetical protein
MTPVTTQAQEARDPLGHAETGTNPAKSYKSCQKFLLGTCGNAMRPAILGRQKTQIAPQTRPPGSRPRAPPTRDVDIRNHYATFLPAPPGQKCSLFVLSSGKNVCNWIISELIYGAVGGVLCLACGIGLLILIPLGIIAIIFPIIGGIKANNGEVWTYPLSLNLIK